MSIIGIVAEYNPFHFGHEYLINMAKKASEEESTVVCVMSGDFVQRGEPALFSKFARAEAACRNGADLVVELPIPWALSSAEGFARGAVGMLNAMGADTLAFGSESGDTGVLQQLAEILCRDDFNETVCERMAKEPNLPYAAARQLVLTEQVGEVASLLSYPNNILAVEYLKAINTLNSKMRPLTVRRIGNAHDIAGDGEIKAARELREIIRQGGDIAGLVPEKAYSVYKEELRCGRWTEDTGLFEAALLSRLRMLPLDSFTQLTDATDGLDTRLFRAAREEASFDAMLAAAKTKRYALSRIRRLYMCAALGVKAGMEEGLPPYIRVLAANKAGCTLLRSISDNSNLPLISKPASVKQLSAKCNDIFELGSTAHDFFSLSNKAVEERKGGTDWRRSPVIVQNCQ